MASLKFYAVCAIVMLVFNNIAAAVKYQQVVWTFEPLYKLK